MKSRIIIITTILVSIFIAIQIFAQPMLDCNRGTGMNKMFHKLNLTETQQTEIQNLKLEHQMNMIDLKANLQKEQLQLAELRNKGNYTREQFIEQTEAINNAKNQIAISKANFQMDIYQILDDNQKKEWNQRSQFCCERKEKHMMRNRNEVRD